MAIRNLPISQSSFYKSFSFIQNKIISSRMCVQSFRSSANYNSNSVTFSRLSQNIFYAFPTNSDCTCSRQQIFTSNSGVAVASDFFFCLPLSITYSRLNGNQNCPFKVHGWTVIPGNFFEKPVASVAKFANMPTLMTPCGWYPMM